MIINYVLGNIHTFLFLLFKSSLKKTLQSPHEYFTVKKMFYSIYIYQGDIHCLTNTLNMNIYIFWRGSTYLDLMLNGHSSYVGLRTSHGSGVSFFLFLFFFFISCLIETYKLSTACTIIREKSWVDNFIWIKISFLSTSRNQQCTIPKVTNNCI